MKNFVIAFGLSLAAFSPAWAAPAASSFGPEIGQAETAGGFVGKLAVTPSHATVGTSITVSAEGLPANQKFDLVWRTVKGSWKAANSEYKGRAYDPVGYRITTVTSDAAGKLAAHFTVPADFGFMHDIVLQQGARLFTQAGFNLDMTMKITPENGPPGTPIAVDVEGIGWRELENSWMLVYDNNFTGWISAVSTAGEAHFTIPATGAAGTHVLQLIHGEFTFPYMNPQQNPVPDRPRFKTNFDVTHGEALLPPPPEQQIQTSVHNLPKTGELVASPAFAGIDQLVKVGGEGFAPGKTYELNWATFTGNRLTATSAWEERISVVAKAEADNAGRVAFQFKVPDDLGGAHNIFVQDGAKKKIGSFWLTPTALPLNVTTAQPGTTLTVHLKGTGWGDTGNIYNLVYDNNYVGFACGVNSAGDISIDLPATGDPGWHFIDLYPGIYKGVETRPNNFRIPQLTYAADHPGEDLPAFHFAIHVTGDAAAPASN